MTTETAPPPAASEPAHKCQRTQEEHAATAQAADTTTASVVADSTLVAVPVVGEQIAGSELVPALQQLLSLYQTEYWALLEELRAKHCTLTSSQQPTDASKTAVSTVQELWNEAAEKAKHQHAAAATASADADGARPKEPQQQDKQQQQPQDSSDAPLPSPFAAQSLRGQQRGTSPADAAEEQQHTNTHLNVPSLQQAEQLLLQLQAGAGGALSPQQLLEMRQQWEAAAPGAAGLEQLASAVALQYMDAQGGLACLCGQQGRWVLRRSAASIGRSTDAKGDVDIDLGGPPAATTAAGAGARAGAGATAGAGGLGIKVSRLQAQLLLTADGSWSITNTGRAAVSVNGQQVARGSTVPLPHLSLLEVAGLPLLFMVNSMAVQRAVARSAHLAM